MIVECTICHEVINVPGLGRKRLNITVNNIFESLADTKNIKATAQELGCSRGYVYKVLKDNGKTPKDFIEVKHG